VVAFSSPPKAFRMQRRKRSGKSPAPSTSSMSENPVSRVRSRLLIVPFIASSVTAGNKSGPFNCLTPTINLLPVTVLPCTVVTTAPSHVVRHPKRIVRIRVRKAVVVHCRGSKIDQRLFIAVESKAVSHRDSRRCGNSPAGTLSRTALRSPQQTSVSSVVALAFRPALSAQKRATSNQSSFWLIRIEAGMSCAIPTRPIIRISVAMRHLHQREPSRVRAAIPHSNWVAIHR